MAIRAVWVHDYTALTPPMIRLANLPCWHRYIHEGKHRVSADTARGEAVFTSNPPSDSSPSRGRLSSRCAFAHDGPRPGADPAAVATSPIANPLLSCRESLPSAESQAREIGTTYFIYLADPALGVRPCRIPAARLLFCSAGPSEQEDNDNRLPRNKRAAPAVRWFLGD